MKTAPRAATIDVRDLAMHCVVPESSPSRDVLRSIDAPLLEAAIAAATRDSTAFDGDDVWVIREVDVAMRVPARDVNVASQARRVARSITRRLAELVADGHGADRVRFENRAEFVAQYVAARRRGSAGSWVFAAFDKLDAVVPATALPIACRLIDAPIWEVVARLVASGEWRRLIEASDAAALEALDRSVAASAPAVPPGRGAIDAVRFAAANVSPPRVAGGQPAARRLLVAGDVLTTFDGRPDYLAAVWTSERARRERGTIRDTRGGRATPVPSIGAEPGRNGVDADESYGPRSVAAAGAVAALVLPGLIDTATDWFLDRTPPAAAARALVLARSVGLAGAPDLAIEILAGIDERHGAGLTRAATVDVVDWAGFGALPAPSQRDGAWLDPDGDTDPIVVALAHEVARSLLRRLAGFAAAPLDYVMPRVAPHGGVVALASDLVEVDLPSPPLRILLQMAGLDTTSVRPPWLDIPIVISHREP